MKKFGLLFALCLMGAYWHWRDRPIQQPPGILVSSLPQQESLGNNAPSFEKDQYRLKSLASFELEARVLGKENYRFDGGADLSPVDLALGWGPMSDSAVLEKIDIEQGHRWYSWNTESFPIPRREIETHSANMHMIPANQTVAKRLKSVRPGQIIKLQGHLVEARRNDGWRWKSSLTRKDTGNGACELIWVESLELN